MITSHPPPELLLEHASGRLAPAVALVIATHLELCQTCQTSAAEMEILGGLLLESQPPADVSDGLLASTLAKLDRQEAIQRQQAAPVRKGTIPRHVAPRTLTPLAGRTYEHLTWNSVVDGVEEAHLPLADRGHRVTLLRARRGSRFPFHDHAGNEYLAVLEGGFCCNGRPFVKGDFASCGSSESHRLVMDTHDECLCLLVLDGPLLFPAAEGAALNAVFRL